MLIGAAAFLGDMATGHAPVRAFFLPRAVLVNGGACPAPRKKAWGSRASEQMQWAIGRRAKNAFGYILNGMGKEISRWKSPKGLLAANFFFVRAIMIKRSVGTRSIDLRWWVGARRRENRVYVSTNNRGLFFLRARGFSRVAGNLEVN